MNQNTQVQASLAKRAAQFAAGAAVIGAIALGGVTVGANTAQAQATESSRVSLPDAVSTTGPTRTSVEIVAVTIEGCKGDKTCLQYVTIPPAGDATTTTGVTSTTVAGANSTTTAVKTTTAATPTTTTPPVAPTPKEPTQAEELPVVG